MNNLDREIVFKMAMISDETNAKVCRLADQYGFDRNMLVEKYYQICEQAKKGYDFNKKKL